MLFVGDSMVQLLQQYEVGMQGGREGWVRAIGASLSDPLVADHV